MAGKNSEIARIMLASNFPQLAKDNRFDITSEATPDYNCIAWAQGRNDCWMWPRTKANPYDLDGISYWPDTDIHDSADVTLFVEAFKAQGYDECGLDISKEEGYEKIALYVKKGTSECIHAARQTVDGSWTSKMGEYNDISHGSPLLLEGNHYGQLYCVMKRNETLAAIADAKAGRTIKCKEFEDYLRKVKE